MRFYFRGLFLTMLLTYSYSTLGSTSVFHSFITDLSPPYICKLKLKAARGVSLDPTHSYQFSGICSIKIPIGTTWIYQNVWVDLQADWNSQTNEGIETATLFNDLGTVVSDLKCDDDPWLTKSQCALVGYQNNTNFTNLGGVFNGRTGQYPPFEIITGQYPPLARNQAILKEAIALSIIAARQEAIAAHTAFAQTFPGQANEVAIANVPSVSPSSSIQRWVKKPARKRATRIFRYPKIDNFRVDCCLKMNKECGKPAADAFCRAMGYKYSVNCKIDTARGTPTFIIGTQTICSQPFCKGFEEIECAK